MSRPQDEGDLSPSLLSHAVIVSSNLTSGIMRILTEEEIKNSKSRKSSIARAERLWKNVRFDYRTKKHNAFTVFDDEKNTIHSVFYASEKKPPHDWMCDCTWYSTLGVKEGIYCAHILAVNLKLTRAGGV